MPTAVEAATHPTDGYGAGLLHPVPFFLRANRVDDAGSAPKRRRNREFSRPEASRAILNGPIRYEVVGFCPRWTGRARCGALLCEQFPRYPARPADAVSFNDDDPGTPSQRERASQTPPGSRGFYRARGLFSQRKASFRWSKCGSSIESAPIICKIVGLNAPRRRSREFPDDRETHSRTPGPCAAGRE